MRLESTLDRKSRLALLVEHFESPRHKGALESADVVVPGGSPECGGSVTIYLKGDGNGEVESLTWTGQGDIISMGSTSIVVDRILNENLTMDEILDEDYEELIDSIGRDIIGNRTRHATLGLSTTKAAVRAYKKDFARRQRFRHASFPSQRESTSIRHDSQ